MCVCVCTAYPILSYPVQSDPILSVVVMITFFFFFFFSQCGAPSVYPSSSAACTLPAVPVSFFR